jgi:transcriptional regulator with XRE-family HTH domain
MTSQSTRPWDEAGYGDIVSAGSDGTNLEITFANGESLNLPLAKLGLAGPITQVDVDTEEPGRVVIHLLGEPPREVGWVTLRSAGDPSFGQEMRRRDAEESRRIGRRLKALREDRGLSQKVVAEMMGMSSPQLSKIESGTFDLRVSTLQSLLRAMDASFGDISGVDVPEVSQKVIRQNARKGGIAPEILDRIFGFVDRRRVPAALEGLFEWNRQALNSPPPLRRLSTAPIAFKGADAENAPRSPVLTMAIRVSELSCSAFAGAEYLSPHVDADSVRRSLSASDEGLTLESLTNWILGIGIPVIPLYGRGIFSAATWQIGRRPCIVIKESRDLSVFWLFDIAHELGHLALGHLSDGWIVDVDEPKPIDNSDKQEQEANDFALDLLLPDHEDLLKSVRAEARGNYLRFKGAVETVASGAHVNPGLLGMVAAYELSDIGEAKDRWGSATNLARSDGSGRPIVARTLWKDLDLDQLSSLDAALLTALIGV